jgi:MFS family permease
MRTLGSRDTSVDAADQEHRRLIEGEVEERGAFWASKGAVLLVVSVALFTDMLVYDVLLPILPEILIRAHSSASKAGTLVASYALGLLFATPILSYWSDSTRDRKTPIIVGQAGLIVATIMFIRARSLWLLIVARILQGIHPRDQYRICSFRNMDCWPCSHC